MAGWRNAVEKIRAFIDGDDNRSEQVLEDIAKPVKHSSSESFLRRIVTEINAIVEEEIIRMPGRAYIPANFTVYLCESDDRNLRRDKREFLETAISELMLEQAKNLAGKLDLTVSRIGIKLKVDGALDDGGLRVEAVSDLKREEMRKSDPREQAALDRTISDVNATLDDVSAGFKPLYYLEVWRDGRKLEEFPIIKPEITFGRKSEGNTANIQLASDNRKISRIHASLRLDDNGDVLVTSLHANPTHIDGRPVPKNERAKLSRDGKFEIYEFQLKLRFPE